jgi:hypothetical protein
MAQSIFVPQSTYYEKDRLVFFVVLYCHDITLAYLQIIQTAMNWIVSLSFTPAHWLTQLRRKYLDYR